MRGKFDGQAQLLAVPRGPILNHEVAARVVGHRLPYPWRGGGEPEFFLEAFETW